MVQLHTSDSAMSGGVRRSSRSVKKPNRSVEPVTARSPEPKARDVQQITPARAVTERAKSLPGPSRREAPTQSSPHLRTTRLRSISSNSSRLRSTTHGATELAEIVPELVRRNRKRKSETDADLVTEQPTFKARSNPSPASRRVNDVTVPAVGSTVCEADTDDKENQPPRPIPCDSDVERQDGSQDPRHAGDAPADSPWLPLEVSKVPLASASQQASQSICAMSYTAEKRLPAMQRGQQTLSHGCEAISGQDAPVPSQHEDNKLSTIVTAETPPSELPALGIASVEEIARAPWQRRSNIPTTTIERVACSAASLCLTISDGVSLSATHDEEQALQSRSPDHTDFQVSDRLDECPSSHQRRSPMRSQELCKLGETTQSLSQNDSSPTMLLEELHIAQDEMSQKSAWELAEPCFTEPQDSTASGEEADEPEASASSFDETHHRQQAHLCDKDLPRADEPAGSAPLSSLGATTQQEIGPIDTDHAPQQTHADRATPCSTSPPAELSGTGEGRIVSAIVESSLNHHEMLDENSDEGADSCSDRSIASESDDSPSAGHHRPATSSQTHPSDCPTSPVVAPRTFHRTWSRRSRLTAQDEFDEAGEGDPFFWDQVFDGQGSFVEPDEDRWDLPDADLTLSQIEQADETDSQGQDFAVPPPQPVPSNVFSGFSTAAARRLPPPNAAAMEKARRLFAESEKEGGDHSANLSLPPKSRRGDALETRAEPESPLTKGLADDRPPVTDASRQVASFQKASGAALYVSQSALRAAERKMADWEAEASRSHAESRPEHQPTMADRTAVLASIPPTSAGNSESPLPPIVPGALDQVQSLDSSQPEAGSEKDPSSSAGPQKLTPASQTLHGRRMSPEPAPVEQRPTSPPSEVQMTPVRPPAPRAHPATGSAPYYSAQSTPITRPRLDARPSRISLGMTPRSKLPAAGAKASFRTPFKDGSRPSLSTTPVGKSSPAILSRKSALSLHKGIPAASPTRASAASFLPTRSDPSVFRLEAIVPRVSLRLYGMVPSRHRPTLEEIPIILANPSMAAGFVFADLSGRDMGPQQALEDLQAAGASHATLAWVKNHWNLILWKLAAYSKSKPDQTDIWWCFEQVCRQLRYRYEREINLAQRSAIKRIQEHDSPASLPMVLCVIDVRRSRQTCDDDSGSTDTGPSHESRYGHVLELTDGWYRILGQIDGPLTRAVRKGKIRRGSKLAIQGAKLESYNAGPSDVLAAFDKAVLMLTGNGTSLAPWDARLGFHRTPMVATLRSLTADGGAVPCMNIVISRLFPVAYVDASNPGGGNSGAPTSAMASKGANGSGARGAAEEAEEHRQWEQRADECRSALQAEFEKEAQSLRDVQDLLSGQGGEDDAEEEPVNFDIDGEAARILEGLIASSASSAFLAQQLKRVGSGGASAVIRQLAQLVAQRIESMGNDSRAWLEAEFARRCPPRRVRSFRVCRFVDLASVTDDDSQDATLRKPYKRTVQLTVWDVDTLEGREDSDSAGIGLGSGNGLGSDGLARRGSTAANGVIGGFLVTGGKYRVTNLIPTQRYAWRGPDVEADVFLATRRDSSWTRLE
ncbi:unnamed protein product [Parajaminaea phylloscopi]